MSSTGRSWRGRGGPRRRGGGGGYQRGGGFRGRAPRDWDSAQPPG